MQADISSENSSITARPSRSKFSTERVRRSPSQLHMAFLYQVRFAKLAVINFAPSTPEAGGTPSHWSTKRYQATAPLITVLILRHACSVLQSSNVGKSGDTTIRYSSATRHAAATGSASCAARGLGAMVAMSRPSAASSVSAATKPTESTDHRLTAKAPSEEPIAAPI